MCSCDPSTGTGPVQRWMWYDYLVLSPFHPVSTAIHTRGVVAGVIPSQMACVLKYIYVQCFDAIGLAAGIASGS